MVLSFKEHLKRWNNSKMTGPLIKIEDVPPKEMSKIASEAFSKMALSKDDNKHIIFGRVLHKYGIMCPHPLHHRLYDGEKTFKQPQEMYTHYECLMCGCAVLNDQYFRRNRDEAKNTSSK